MHLINYPHVAGEVFSVPHYATRQTMDAVKAVLIPRLNGTVDANHVMSAIRPEQTQTTSEAIAGDVAVISVHGLLTARRGIMTSLCTEMSSYEMIRSQIYQALNDQSIAEIVLDINSGGGMAVGCKELADYIFASRDIKPITAIINFNAFSAAYFIAAACSKVVLSQTSGVGSIGVILEHMETSKLDEQVGLKFTSFYRGDYKNAGSPHEPLSAESNMIINEMIDNAFSIFVDSVAQYRGLTTQQVIDTQARCYTGQAAIDIGLADELSDPQTAINNIAARQQAIKTQTNQQSILVRAAAMDLQAKL